MSPLGKLIDKIIPPKFETKTESGKEQITTPSVASSGKTIFVASWKANMGSIENAKKFFEELPEVAKGFTKREVILCPSYLFMEMAKEKIPSTIKLGAQDVSRYSNGPYTGEITASTLSNFGVKYSIIGHMERRILGDTDDIVNKKVHQCLSSGIVPIITVGENVTEYNNNMTRVVLEKQLKEAIKGVKDYQKLVFCYQPAWSIGTGHYTSGEYANLIADFMRQTIKKISGLPMAASIPILYGGGVTISNAKEYLEQQEIDGLMFGIGTTTVGSLAQMINVPFKVRTHF
ncbi:MAG: triose-phosphate isomerase [Firmicutes bacterium]|nr:triose-phosphate isomerase [Bacillota bacterium]